MDGSHFGGEQPVRQDPWPHTSEGGPDVPEREWSLSAGQVVTVVLVILAVCEILAALGS